jgi:ppGpp synthetase/RelA/SpoT-type nucleotidyltranferase
MNRREIEILAQFNAIKPHLNIWGDFVDSFLINDLLKDMIEDHFIKIYPSYRLKDDRSYLFKALYRKKNYSEPIENIEDKIGTRVVVLKSDDIKVVQQRILDSTTWVSKLTKNIDQEIDDKPNIFDYQSSHIVVRPLDGDDKFPSDVINSLTCEIQIRTLLQHAFAEVSHDSTYKGPYKNDKEILRRLAKAMALMEATDDYFCNIFEMMSDEKRYYKSYLKEIIDLYKQYNHSFDSSELNIFITDSIFDLLEFENIPIHELEAFTSRHHKDLQTLIQPKNGLLFQQPTIILTLFYFYNKRTFLRDNWPLNIDVLKSIYKTTGTAYDNY